MQHCSHKRKRIMFPRIIENFAILHPRGDQALGLHFSTIGARELNHGSLAQSVLEPGYYGVVREVHVFVPSRDWQGLFRLRWSQKIARVRCRLCSWRAYWLWSEELLGPPNYERKLLISVLLALDLFCGIVWRIHRHNYGRKRRT